MHITARDGTYKATFLEKGWHYWRLTVSTQRQVGKPPIRDVRKAWICQPWLILEAAVASKVGSISRMGEELHPSPTGGRRLCAPPLRGCRARPSPRRPLPAGRTCRKRRYHTAAWKYASAISLSFTGDTFSRSLSVIHLCFLTYNGSERPFACGCFPNLAAIEDESPGTAQVGGKAPSVALCTPPDRAGEAQEPTWWRWTKPPPFGGRRHGPR